MVPDDQDDGHEIIPAEQRLAGHLASIGYLRAGPATPEREARIAQLEREFVPGPGRRRRRSEASKQALRDYVAAGRAAFELKYGRPATEGLVQLEPARGFDPTKPR